MSLKSPVSSDASSLLTGCEEICQCTEPVDGNRFADIRRRLILDSCKWDPQVGDIPTLASFALVLSSGTWRQLGSWAEQLAAEVMEAEEEVLRRPALLRRLGLPRRIVRLLADQQLALTPAAARVIRFDFHWTRDGWRISEANTDVPGGYCEAGYFTRLMAREFPHLRTVGDPGQAVATALARRSGAGPVALLAATGYLEDQQVVAYLANQLAACGIKTLRAHPRQLRWHNGSAHLGTDGYHGSVTGIVRFYQGEWLPCLPGDWSKFIRGGITPVCAPGNALIAESKRFPLVWESIKVPMRTWRTLLPETRDPRDVRLRGDDDWLLKTAFCNTGDTVTIRGRTSPSRWRLANWWARACPGTWVAQRRFEALPLDTPWGTKYPCVGVYTVDGTAVGIYGRLSHHTIVDYAAVDVAVLVDDGTNDDSRIT